MSTCIRSCVKISVFVCLFWCVPFLAKSYAATSCGGKTNKTSYCGRSNFCICCTSRSCSGGGNCVWWAWEAACRNWKFAFATCNNAHRWNEQARSRNIPTGNSPRDSSVFVCENGGSCSYKYGHVGWVVKAHANGSFSTTEQSCSTYCGTSSKTRPKGYATGGFIYNPKAPQLKASFVSQSTSAGGASGGAQHSLCPGQSFTFSFKLKNTGNVNWIDNGKYTTGNAVRLGFRSGEKFQGADRISVKSTSNTQVKPGESVAFNIQGTAPTKGGVYKSEWQLVSEKVAWFGPKVWLSFHVTSTPPGLGDNCNLSGQSPGCEKGTKQCTAKGVTCVGVGGSEEVCDKKDNDCNGKIDDLERKCYQGPDGTQDQGSCKSGTQTCKDGEWGECVGEVLPTKEICGNELDDNCDGQVDEQCPTCEDKDKDGYRAGAACTGEQDCDDNDPNVYPGAPEICGNAKDDDCRGGDNPCNTGQQKPIGTTGCVQNADCQTSYCGQVGTIARCTKHCMSDSDCPNNLMCMNQMCWPYQKTSSGATVTLEPCDPAKCEKGSVCVDNECTKMKGYGCDSLSSTLQTVGPLWFLLLLLVPFVLSRRKAAMNG
ncbi:MAG TPA: hypothetical protein DCE42_23300 [Myxococcales bacterium]|nr:hypothetical protein [Deltaproteobacteria bacterium]MBU50206.1 hypothetical protein [Deltaproteobacteria bacterium]HAA57713.1 hypothetical protein [Myxococcales bacterium]